jgi:glycosyltransferase
MKISIITPTYNSSQTLQQTIDSIKEQTYLDYEHMIVDNCSTDNTIDICKQNNIHHLSEKDKGIYDAFNKGIAHTNGEIIALLNSDDVYFDSNVLKSVVEIFKNTNVDIVYGNIVYISKSNPYKMTRKWRTSPIKKILIWLGWIMPHPAVFVRRCVYQDMGGFDSTFRLSADYDFLLRVIHAKTYRLEFLNKTLIKMRTGGASDLGLIDRIKEWWIIIKIFKKYYKIYPIWFFVTRPIIKIHQFFNIF